MKRLYCAEKLPAERFLDVPLAVKGLSSKLRKTHFGDVSTARREPKLFFGQPPTVLQVTYPCFTNMDSPFLAELGKCPFVVCYKF